MKILKLSFLFLATIFASACSEKKATISTNTNTEKTAANNGKIELISPADFDKAVTGKKVQLVDVRSNMEYKKGHLKDAALCDFMADDFTTQLANLNLNKEEAVYIYCHSGGRSGEAAEIMKGLGYQHVIDMKNGYSDWSAQNLPSTLD